MKKIAVVGLVGAAMICAAARADDLDVLKKQMREYLLTNKYSNLFDTINPELDSEKFLDARKFMESMQPDGSWASIDYKSRQRGSWPVNGHMSRVTTMAKAYCAPGSKYQGSTRMLAAIRRALQFWLANDFVSPNWWHNEIGVPREMGRTLILVGDKLPKEDVSRAIEMVMMRSRIGRTGQNKIWLAGNVFMRGLLTRDAQLVAQAARAIGEEVRVTTAEGVQPDWSFHQHGPQLQFGNYGLSYANDCAMWANILRGTRFAFDEEKVTILRNYLLEGLGWVVWDRSMDISACGRQLFPDQPRKKARLVAEVFPVMAAADGDAHRGDYKNFVERYVDSGGSLVGHKHFWRSDFTVHRMPGAYCSVKMSSPRVIGTEVVNSENLLGYHLADGATYVYRSGDEYRNIFPVWDWRKLPGTTCLQSDSPLPSRAKDGYRNASAFVGGVSDGVNGVTAMNYDRDGLRAKKAWFFKDGEILCLGTGITTEKEQQVLTTIDQRLLDGKAVMQGAEFAEGISEFSSPGWIWHDGVGYVVMEKSNFVVRAGEQNGRWSNVYSAGSDKETTKDVFCAYIDHGWRPQNAEYFYKVLPGIDLESMKNGRTGHLMMLANNEDVQAAVCVNWAGVVFHRPSRVNPFGRFSLAIDKPGLVMLEREGQRLEISVVEPTVTREVEQFTLTLSGKFEGEGCTYDEQAGKTRCVIELPAGEGQRGSTVGVSLKAL